jgi:hypothetical protein
MGSGHALDLSRGTLGEFVSVSLPARVLVAVACALAISGCRVSKPCQVLRRIVRWANSTQGTGQVPNSSVWLS